MNSSITATYPGFQLLPKRVKQMLLISESVFFEEARTVQSVPPGNQKDRATVKQSPNSPGPARSAEPAGP